MERISFHQRMERALLLASTNPVHLDLAEIIKGGPFDDMPPQEIKKLLRRAKQLIEIMRD